MIGRGGDAGLWSDPQVEDVFAKVASNNGEPRKYTRSDLGPGRWGIVRAAVQYPWQAVPWSPIQEIRHPLGRQRLVREHTPCALCIQDGFSDGT